MENRGQMSCMTVLIEKYANDNDCDYIEAIVGFAEEQNIDVEDIVDNIDETLKLKVKKEFIKKNFIPSQKIEGTLDDFLND